MIEAQPIAGRTLWALLALMVSVLATAVSSTENEFRACDFAIDTPQCKSSCKSDDMGCQVDWLRRDAEHARTLAVNAEAHISDISDLCIPLPAYQIKLCKEICVDQDKQCELAVVQDWAADRESTYKEWKLEKRLADKEKAAPTLASLQKNDPRKPLDRVAHPEYQPIGVVKTKVGRGTGWLANECLVWTSRHVIAGEEYIESIIGERVTFFVGSPPTAKAHFHYQSEGVVVASGGVADSEDWAIIKLDESLGRKVGSIPTGQYSVEDAQTCVALELAGFPGGKAVDTLWWQGECPLDAEISNARYFSLDCPVTPGNSGGPLLCRETNGELRAIGIVSFTTFGAYVTALNFTERWEVVKPAYLRFRDTCP